MLARSDAPKVRKPRVGRRRAERGQQVGNACPLRGRQSGRRHVRVVAEKALALLGRQRAHEALAAHGRLDGRPAREGVRQQRVVQQLLAIAFDDASSGIRVNRANVVVELALAARPEARDGRRQVAVADAPKAGFRLLRCRSWHV